MGKIMSSYYIISSQIRLIALSYSSSQSCLSVAAQLKSLGSKEISVFHCRGAHRISQNIT